MLRASARSRTRRRSTLSPNSVQPDLSPLFRPVPKVRRRCPRRGVRYQHPTWQRPAPGRVASVLGGRDPGGPLRPLPPRRQQWSLCAATALRAQGVNVDVRATGRGGKPKHRSGAQNRRTRVPKGNPGTRAGSQGARRGSQGGLQPKPPGPGGTGPGLPSRHPRTRRTRGGPRRGRTARATTPAGRTDEPSIKAASRPQAKGALAEVMGHQVRKADGRGNEAFTLVAAVSGARSLPGSHVPAQEGLPQGRGRYRGRRGGAGAPCRGAWEVGTDRSPLRWQVLERRWRPEDLGSASGMTGRLPG